VKTEQRNTDIAGRYTAIVANLDSSQIALIWRAALLGRTPDDQTLVTPIAQLNALRDDVGKSSARVQRPARGAA
jgi:hypothetical protein